MASIQVKMVGRLIQDDEIGFMKQHIGQGQAFFFELLIVHLPAFTARSYSA